MIRRPPRSTLFPTRRSSDLLAESPSWPISTALAQLAQTWAGWLPCAPSVRRLRVERPRMSSSGLTRSEEHTSELQSQSNLVCRLLLEKKKKKTEHTEYDCAG